MTGFVKTRFILMMVSIFCFYSLYATAENSYIVRNGVPHPIYIYGADTIYYPPRLFTIEEFRNTVKGFRVVSAVEPVEWDKILAEVDGAFVELSSCLVGIPEFEFGKFVIKPHQITQNESELLRGYPIVLRLIPFFVGNQESAGVLWPSSHIEVGINTFSQEFRGDLKHEWLHVILDLRLGKLYKMETLGPFAHHQVPMEKCAPFIERNQRKVGNKVIK